MGKKAETSQETQIKPRSAQEQQLLDLFANLTQQAGGQLEGIDLSSLLSGEGLVPQQSDIRLAEQAIGATGSIARRELEDFVKQGNLGLDESLSARGIQGSSRESVERGLVQRDANRQAASMLDAESGRQANLLAQLPFQRAGVQLNANQALLARLGLGQFAGNFGLQERLASTSTQGEQTESGFSAGDLAQLGSAAAAF